MDEMKAEPSVADQVQLMRTVTQHRDYVRLRMLDVIQDLERRSMAHDVSKLSPDEFDGFSRINRIAREHPYGSEEYRASMRTEKETIDLHYDRNSHHPEHHKLPHRPCVQETMGFLDIIEMVCDWRAAYLAYGSQGTWGENMERQHERYKDTFSSAQWWLIYGVAQYIYCAEENNKD